MRKAFKFLFKTLKHSSDEGRVNYVFLFFFLGITLLKAHKVCIQHYFGTGQENSEMNLLPFRKNSKIKTMNLTFLEKVFSS